MAIDGESSEWVAATSLDELMKRKKIAVDTDAGQFVLLWHNDAVHAMANICVHRERELVRGVILNDRLICPGHQWAFDLETGVCKERERTQPVHDTFVEGGTVHVSIKPRNTDANEI